MVKKIILSHDQVSEYIFIGVTTTLKDYRLAFLLNNSLNLNLKKIRDFIKPSENETPPNFFSFYTGVDPNHNLFVYLLSNRHPEERLVPQFRHVDYFLLLKNTGKKHYVDELLKKIKKIPNVMTAFLPDLTNINSINQILEDIELHLLDSGQKEE